MDAQQVVRLIVDLISKESSLEGAYLSGSLVGEDRDAFSDIDLGIVSKDNQKDLRTAYALHARILDQVGQPLQLLERAWEHCQMVAALYGKSQFPPIGLEVDLIYSQLKHVSEQMPYRNYEIVYDRSGKLKTRLEGLPRQKPASDTEAEIKEHLRWFPFQVYDALRALGRKDRANLNALMEEMRKAVFYAAAARRQGIAHGAKRGYKHLTPDERWIVGYSYQTPGKRAVHQLADLYVSYLTELQEEYSLQTELERLRRSLAELL